MSSLNILTRNGVHNVGAELLSDRPNLLLAENGLRFKVRTTASPELQLCLFVFETGGYFTKRSFV